MSNLSGNPCENGVWSYGSYSKEYPKVLTFEYPISTGHMTAVEIGAVVTVGNDVLVSWKDSTTTPVYGIDKVDTSAKLTTGYIETRIITIDRANQKNFKVNAFYRTMPTGCSITIEKSVNYGSFASMTVIKDTDINCVYGSTRVEDTNTIQFRITLNSSSNDAPELESIIIEA